MIGVCACSCLLASGNTLLEEAYRMLTKDEFLLRLRDLLIFLCFQ
jgi:hypothetical protein